MPTAMTPAQAAAYERDGFVVVRGLFDAEETSLLRRAMEEDPAVRGHVIDRRDQEGRSTRIALWNRAGDSVYGLAARCARMVDTAEALLGGEAYHFQSKLTAKDPEVGGAWEWHQDYGYWYHNGCLEPRLVSCLLAIDRATQANGCLQVVRGSHRLGRLEHGKVGDQTGVADAERLEAILARHELVHCELEPGGAVLFHSNLLHRSDQNRSEHPRWAFICCYNARSNSPYKATRHPGYSRLEKWPHEQIGAVAQRRLQ